MTRALSMLIRVSLLYETPRRMDWRTGRKSESRVAVLRDSGAEEKLGGRLRGFAMIPPSTPFQIELAAREQRARTLRAGAFGPAWRCIAALVALAALLGATPSRAGTFSDLWYSPQQSGWGMGLVQQADVAFVTLFVYGPDGAPTWYFASDARLASISSSGLPAFAGVLYRSRGPWHGGPFDPSRVDVLPVGEIRVEALSNDRLDVRYSAEGVRVEREVVRQTWQVPPIGPFYLSTFLLRQSQPGGALAGVVELRATTLFFVQDGLGVLRADDNLGRRCEYSGPYVQSGKLGTMTGAFACTATEGVAAMAGSFELGEVEVTANGVTATLRTSSPGLEQSGRFGGIKG